MSATVAGTTFRPTRSYTTLRDTTLMCCSHVYAVDKRHAGCMFDFPIPCSMVAWVLMATRGRNDASPWLHVKKLPARFVLVSCPSLAAPRMVPREPATSWPKSATNAGPSQRHWPTMIWVSATVPRAARR
jgi:hypothetical protein